MLALALIELLQLAPHPVSGPGVMSTITHLQPKLLRLAGAARP